MMTPIEVAEYLMVSPWTLAKWRCSRSHVNFVRGGRAIYYRRSDVEAFADKWFKTIQCGGNPDAE